MTHPDDSTRIRAVVVGASSGIGRCIATGLGQRGARVALLARRIERLNGAANEAGSGSIAIACDVTEEKSCDEAINEAAEALGGIDALVYTPAIGPLARIESVSADTWARIFATNVTGAALVTAAALPHLKLSRGRAVFLSSISATYTAPWPGLGAYAVSKAGLERLVEVLRTEHPEVAFTRLVVGNCVGGQGESATGFADDWDWELAGELHSHWSARGYVTDKFIDVEELVNVVDSLLRSGSSTSVSSIVVTQPGFQ
ncbi:MAG TPA: SDR family oxidoreductase [Acidimicrobiales bacterium]|nr:SDR family oxidoreductase [Acidimicrobiales bacterium]